MGSRMARWERSSSGATTCCTSGQCTIVQTAMLLLMCLYHSLLPLCLFPVRPNRAACHFSLQRVEG